ncbi:hypothetical protein E4V99_13975 [Microbacterium sp. dk485]|uniref:hypothetical protein n=1 Tax=Microbacterium sp. dk485 TaxID=2560021 RepID=UPI001073864A|nr:hypothetical protein [Microbacterium sp. dk485]TFV82037.1 hypothetical protein E4V99_13975 [Microbacterium sp. dk485]
MGIFGRRIADAYKPAPSVPIAVASPWQPTDVMTQITVDQLIASEMRETGLVPVTRDTALRVPAIKRAHGIHCTLFAQTPFRLTDAKGVPTDDQPEWLGNSRSGVSPYHRKYGIASDLFFNGWAAVGFTSDMSDALHIPFGAWSASADGRTIEVENGIVPPAYRARVVAIPLGYGENGLLIDGVDTVRQARLIENAYMDRLENPVPLTFLGIPKDVWESWSPEERKEYRDQYVEGRKAANGSVALKVAEFPVEFPGMNGEVDLFESGRNAVRLDIANHTGTEAGLLEGMKQGGSGGSEISYSGVANGVSRNEFWDYSAAKRFVLAFEARMSLDDVSPADHAIRGDLTSYITSPTPTSNPASEA